MVEIMSGACVINDKKVLVLQQKEDGPQPLKWGPPGGHGEHGENPIETAKREVKEETNLDIEIKGLVGASLAETPSGKTYLVILYSGEAQNPDQIRLSAESDAFRWVNLDEINRLELREPLLKYALTKALTQPPAPADIIQIINFNEEH